MPQSEHLPLPIQHAANKHFPTKNGGYSDKNFNFVVICPQNQQERRKVIN